MSRSASIFVDSVERRELSSRHQIVQRNQPDSSVGYRSLIFARISILPNGSSESDIIRHCLPQSRNLSILRHSAYFARTVKHGTFKGDEADIRGPQQPTYFQAVSEEAISMSNGLASGVAWQSSQTLAGDKVCFDCNASNLKGSFDQDVRAPATCSTSDRDCNNDSLNPDQHPS